MLGLGIQKRLLMIAILPTLLISIIFGSYIIYSKVHQSENQLKIYGNTILNHVLHNARHALLKNDRRKLEDIARTALEEKEVISLSFYTPSKNLLSMNGTDENTESYLKNVTANHSKISFYENHDVFVYVAPVIINEFFGNQQKILGWVVLTLSRTHTLLFEYQLIFYTLLFLSFCLSLSFILSRKLTQRLFAPFQQINDAIKKLEKGQLDTKINLTTGTEFDELAKNINNLTSGWQKNQDDLHNTLKIAGNNLSNSIGTIEKQNSMLADAQKETLEASRIKSEFIANISHEIRTPMNGIIGFTNLLLETELSKLQRNYLLTIQKSTLNLLTLVNNILDFSRLDAGQLKLDYVSFDLRESIEEVLTITSPLANAKHLEFAALVDENIPNIIFSDSLRFKQIIINLVSNAIKFTEKGEVIINVKLLNEYDSHIEIKVEVSDTGIGLSSIDQKIIFGAFQQADPSIARRYGGTGLGLAICKKLVEQLGGNIGMESNEGKGSTFWFSFAAERVLHPEEVISPDNINLEGKTILCVDDNIHNANLVNALLTGAKATVKIAHDGTEAIQQLEVHQFDLILMDLRMPSMDGIEALNHIKKHNLHNNAPIIALSAHISEHEYQDLTEVGFNDFLTKPILKKTLLRTVRKWLIEDKLLHENWVVETTKAKSENLPIIDWDLALKLSGNNKKTAKEIFVLLLQTIPQEMQHIKNAKKENDKKALLCYIHKLHGAICYCGVPRLKYIIAQLETALKANENIEDLFYRFEDAVNELIQEANEEIFV